MKTIEPRLDRLEALVPKGCDVCRSWGPCVYEDYPSGARTRPEDCPACGRHVPVRVVVRLIGVRADDV